MYHIHEISATPRDRHNFFLLAMRNLASESAGLLRAGSTDFVAGKSWLVWVWLSHNDTQIIHVAGIFTYKATP